MKKMLLIGIFSLILSMLMIAGHVQFNDFSHRSTSTIKKEITLQPSIQRLVVDNVIGKISVNATATKRVKLTAVRTNMGSTKAKLKLSETEVTLDISQSGEQLELYVNGPFRRKRAEKIWRYPEFLVQFDFELEVPKRLSVKLKTATNGDIDVRGINGNCHIRHANGKVTVSRLKGDYHIKTANGRIRLDHINGSGNAHTVNGSVIANFIKNPKKACSFKTVNGNLKLNFVKGLAADFKVKTKHGEILSDYPFDYLPQKPDRISKQNGKFRYSSNRFQNVRIGNGGPLITLDTFVGNIYINRGEK